MSHITEQYESYYSTSASSNQTERLFVYCNDWEEKRSMPHAQYLSLRKLG